MTVAMIVLCPYDLARLISSCVSAVPSAVYLLRTAHFYIAFLYLELIEKHFLKSSHFIYTVVK
jgi:hypothetical protein